MENQQQKSKLTQWLDLLQQESWQLELLVSAFAIFLTLGVFEYLTSLNIDLDLVVTGLKDFGNAVSLGYIILLGACTFLLVNLILHVLLRGVWISSIGLRYVSGDIDFEALRFTARFDRFLRKKIGNFDSYIGKLENLCSIVFAFTFLIIFMLLAFGIWMLLFGASSRFLVALLPAHLEETAKSIAGVFFLFTGLLYLLDFVTLGYLKRIKWLAPVYFPIYRLYSFATFAPLYRPIYYNLIDNKFGKKIGFLLIPYVVVVSLLLSVNFKTYPLFPDESGDYLLRKGNYNDLGPEGNGLVNRVSIPSKYVGNGFLEVFVRYLPKSDDETVGFICPGFKPLKETGIRTSIVINGSGKQRQGAADTALVCLGRLYEIRIDDSVFQSPSWHFYEHQNEGEPGLITILDVAYLSRGRHELIVKKQILAQREDRDSLYTADFAKIPFWKE